MNTPILGKDKVLMFRLLQDQSKANATRLALQTTHTIKYSRKNDTTPTKDGMTVSIGPLETTIDIEALGSDDLSVEVLSYAQRKGLAVEVWEINFKKKKFDGRYEALYGVGYLSDWEMPASVDENTTVKTTLTIAGELVAGLATVSPLDEATAFNFYRDTVPGAVEQLPIDQALHYAGVVEKTEDYDKEIKKDAHN